MNVKQRIDEVLNANMLAVLATQGSDQPHASLMVYTVLNEGKELIFATYRQTRKFRNIQENPRVAVLIHNRTDTGMQPQNVPAVTAYGIATIIEGKDYPSAVRLHVGKHPELEAFVISPECVLLKVDVDEYEVVSGIGTITWYRYED